MTEGQDKSSRSIVPLFQSGAINILITILVGSRVSDRCLRALDRSLCFIQQSVQLKNLQEVTYHKLTLHILSEHITALPTSVTIGTMSTLSFVVDSFFLCKEIRLTTNRNH